MDTLARIGVLDDMKNHEIQDPLVEIFSMSGLYKGESPRPKTAENKEILTLHLLSLLAIRSMTQPPGNWCAWMHGNSGTLACPLSVSE